MNVLIATINIYRAARSRVRRNATRLFTRVLQLSTHCFTRERDREKEGEKQRKGKKWGAKKKKIPRRFSMVSFLQLEMAARGHSLRFPTIDIQFTGQSKYPFHSPNRSTISRIPFGLRSLLDGRRRNGYGRIFTGQESVSCRTRVARGKLARAQELLSTPV